MIANDNQLRPRPRNRDVQAARVCGEPDGLGAHRGEDNDVLLVSLEGVHGRELDGRIGHLPVEERALRSVERNHAEGLCRGMGLQKVHDDAHLAIVEKRVCE